jgi:hypothetical protein
MSPTQSKLWRFKTLFLRRNKTADNTVSVVITSEAVQTAEPVEF